ncbi:MAG: nitrogen assimilation transcriptional regulator NAC [Granulosicoccus sp.]
MDTRRLQAFVKIVDIGSITRASTVLHIAQPALSQQIAALESHFDKPLLIRSKRGVVPTEAGKILYRHCQLILKQMNQAQLEISSSGEGISGFVSLGLAPLSVGSLVATRFIMLLQEEHPGIILHINENVGGIISEMVLAGKMDIALIYDPGSIPGLSFEPVQTEELYFVTAEPVNCEGGEVALSEVVTHQLILPSRIHTLRQVIDLALSRADLESKVVMHTESISMLAGAMGEGLGSTILPRPAALAICQRLPEAKSYRIFNPKMEVNMAICVSKQLPLSEPAMVVRTRLTELVQQIADENSA